MAVTGPFADLPPTEFTSLSGCTLPSLIQACDARCSRRQRRLCGQHNLVDKLCGSSGKGGGGCQRHHEVAVRKVQNELAPIAGSKVGLRPVAYRLCPPQVSVTGVGRLTAVAVCARGIEDVGFRYHLALPPPTSLKIKQADLRHVPARQ